MKKIVIAVGLIILVVLVGFAVLKKPKAPVVNPIVSEGAVAPEEGIYAVSSGSTVAWQGSRPLVEGYMDSGILNIKEGEVTVNENSVVGEFIFDMKTIKAEVTGSGKGGEMLSTHLQSPDFFDVALYPEAKLTITKVTPTDVVHEYTAEGKLTMKNVENDISFPITAYSEDGDLHIHGVVSVDRTKWNVKYGSGKFFEDLADKMIDDMFTVKIDLVLTNQE